jgi:hypothetical protein
MTTYKPLTTSTSIPVNPADAGRLAELAKVWGVTREQAVGRLLDAARVLGLPGAVPGSDEVAIHAVYGGLRADAVYNMRTRLVTIISGPGAGATDLTSSRAAGIVVHTVNPAVSPSRRGPEFWIVTATGRPVSSLLPPPRTRRSRKAA